MKRKSRLSFVIVTAFSMALAALPCAADSLAAADSAGTIAGKAADKVAGKTSGQAAPRLVEGPFAHPESVATDGSFFYVSNVGRELAPLARDGDGFVSRLSRDFEVLDARFITGLDAPKGLAVAGTMLLVADLGAVKGFDLATGRQVLSVDFAPAGATFLNGLAVRDGRTAFVSATDTNTVYAIDLAAGTFAPLAIDCPLAGPNGLAWDPATQVLYIAGFGVDNKPTGGITAADLSGERPVCREVSAVRGLFDGLVLTNGRLIASDWVRFEKAGRLVAVDPASGAVTELALLGPIGGPADFMLDPATGRLVIPAMIENHLVVIEAP